MKVSKLLELSKSDMFISFVAMGAYSQGPAGCVQQHCRQWKSCAIKDDLFMSTEHMKYTHYIGRLDLHK